ncbi:hypothetical protein NESM_000160800 [Novymonas esmeraldas]|uniref:Uncharacterized protein n=1 Tax=Novymonas esmeraldas TaxID=1808958 RepID=A0AAW0F426_9TRYP
MAQKSLRSKSKEKSAGALRKYVGEAKKKFTYTKAKKTPETKARANYIKSVEAAMASRVPSDQRSKLSIVKAGGPREKKKNMKKPLTRGRKRKPNK